jgi:hypothetical protein
MKVDERSRALYYYLANQEAINEGHLGDYVAISNNQVLGYYKNDLEGLKDAKKRGFDIDKVNVSKCFPVGDAEFHMGLIPIGRPL